MVISGNPLLAYGVADTAQTVSYIRYVNRKNGLEFDKNTQSFYNSHPSTLIKNPAF